jgi:hypothetical protein
VTYRLATYHSPHDSLEPYRLALISPGKRPEEAAGQEGEPRSRLEPTARNVKFLGNTGDGEPPPLTGEELAEKDEIPFW